MKTEHTRVGKTSPAQEKSEGNAQTGICAAETKSGVLLDAGTGAEQEQQNEIRCSTTAR
jgi:hypothetical protein